MTLIFLAIALALGSLLFAVVLAIQEVRAPSRRYLDAVPGLWKLLWPPTEWLAFWLRTWVEPRLKPERVASLNDNLQRMGWSSWMLPFQFIALRLICVLVGAFAGLILAMVLQASASMCAIAGSAFGWVMLGQYMKDQIHKRQLLTLKQLPFMMDLLTLAVEAGKPLSLAMSLAVKQGAPGPLRDELVRAQRDMRAGKPRAQAMNELAYRMNLSEVTSWVATMALSESQGMQLGPLLRAQADARRNERFLRAEKLALQAPVKMIFPLVAFIFPGTFAILLFPVAQQMLTGGMFK